LSDLFRTQEVGSLSRAPFLKKPGLPESAEMALYWGRLLKVEGHELLYRSLREGRFTQESLLEWASLYGIRFHEAAGLDVVYDGEQRRVEMYEHLMQKVENAVFLGRVKVWDAETYRKAAIIGVPRLRSSAYLEEFLFVRSKARKEVKVPVTGPYTLMDWSYDEFYVTRQNRELGPLERRKRAREEMLYDLVENVVRPELRALVEAGARRIQIDEPALTTKPEEVELYVEAFNEMVKGIDCDLHAPRLLQRLLQALPPHSGDEGRRVLDRVRQQGLAPARCERRREERLLGPQALQGALYRGEGGARRD